MATVSSAAPTGAAASAGCSTLEPARWLIGTWTATSGTERVVEEWRHDFPRRLEYTYAAPDRMTVRVSDGATKAFTLDFRRTP
jgi:hypothetical protein